MCSFQGTGDNSRFSHLWIRTQSVLITDILRISFLEKKYRLSQINLHRRFFFSIKAALKLSNGDKEIRTPDPLLARQVLSQLSYTPMVLFFKAFSIVFSFSFAWKNVVGLTRLELVTSRLSGVRSNQLSYRPIFESYGSLKTEQYFEISDVRPPRS